MPIKDLNVKENEMPNISAHMIIAKKVGEKLNITSDDFIRGNLLPDIIDIEDSHFKIFNGVYCIPDINKCLKELDLSKDINIGYLVHLLLDKYYLVDYLGKKYPNQNIFLDNKVYLDYDFLNFDLVNKFKLDINYLEAILKNYNCKILEEKLKNNIEYLKQRKEGKTAYINFNSFSLFLSNVSEVISKEVYMYANKRS